MERPARVTHPGVVLGSTVEAREGRGRGGGDAVQLVGDRVRRQPRRDGAGPITGADIVFDDFPEGSGRAWTVGGVRRTRTLPMVLATETVTVVDELGSEGGAPTAGGRRGSGTAHRPSTIFARYAVIRLIRGGGSPKDLQAERGFPSGHPLSA